MPRLVWAALVAVLVLCVCVAAAVQLTGTGGGEGGGPAAHAGTERRAPVVFALGDSYTVGIRGIRPERAYAAECARLLGWQIVVGGQARTGFAGTGGTGETFSSLFGEQLAWRPAPDMVLVSGGHNDVRMPPGLVAQRARRLLETVGDRWPRTQLVLMGPMWGGDPGPKALRVRDVLREVAKGLRIPFVDPLAQQWITGNVRGRTGNADQLIRSDGTHPNPAGNRHIARRLADELRSMRLDRPVLGRAKVGYAAPRAPVPPPTTPGAGSTGPGHEQAVPRPKKARP